MNKIKLLNYLIIFDNIDCKIYEDEFFKGICFSHHQTSYDIFLNKIGLERIIITPMHPAPDDYLYQDIPLNENTIKLLPDSIKIYKLEIT